MARTGIDRQQVFAAAAQLSEDGTRPTVQNVREKIGSGSYSTITAHLAAWREEHAASTAPPPPAIPDEVQSAFARIWGIAAKAAHDTLDQQREAFEALRRDIETEKLEMAAEIERLEKALDEQAARADLKAAECDELKQTVSTAAETANALKIKNTRLEEQRNAARERGDELKGQLDTLQGAFHAAVQTMQQQADTKPAAAKSSPGRSRKAKGTNPEPE